MRKPGRDEDMSSAILASAVMWTVIGACLLVAVMAVVYEPRRAPATSPDLLTDISAARRLAPPVEPKHPKPDFAE